MIRVGVIGYGYWGPNIVRNFSLVEGATVEVVCDRSTEMHKKIKAQWPHMNINTDSDEVITSPDIDLVAIVTPVSTHFSLAKQALLNGKHVFVEKPMTATVEESEELVELAEQKGLTLMVDHTFMFTGAVRKMKEVIEERLLGDIYYYDSTRINLGIFQHDINVIWDLAPHDFSILSYLIDEKPLSVSASGVSHVGTREDVAYIHVHFSNSFIAHFNVNWLSPVKVRNTLVGGEKRMLLWDDMMADEKIRIYDKGVEVKQREGMYDLLVSYRAGDMWAPRIEQTEALRYECRYCIKCIENNTRPINDGLNGLYVVRLLNACDESLKIGGGAVDVK